MVLVTIKGHSDEERRNPGSGTLVTPSSEKLKFGRGASARESRIKLGTRKLVDKCLSPRKRYRTWLIKYYFFII